MRDMDDDELLEEIARTKTRLAELYAAKKARGAAAKNVVPRDVKKAVTRKRNREIWRLCREERQTYKQLGIRFGLGRDHIRNIVLEMDRRHTMAALREKWRVEREAEEQAPKETIEEFMARREREAAA